MYHDPRWPQEFEQTRSSILQSCEGRVVAAEHIGSTAISGLIARPTVDVIAGVSEAGLLEDSAALIEGLNYRTIQSPDWCGGHPLITLSKPRSFTEAQPQQTHSVLLTIIDSPIWNQSLAIRDWLRSHPDVAIDYEELKVQRWRDGEGDLDSYNEAKSYFFADLIFQIQNAE